LIQGSVALVALDGAVVDALAVEEVLLGVEELVAEVFGVVWALVATVSAAMNMIMAKRFMAGRISE
jgi:drug/metabolite transporter (DMT)-like permease